MILTLREVKWGVWGFRIGKAMNRKEETRDEKEQIVL